MRPLLSLHFVRHGETTANREGIIQGHKDYDLTPLGSNQALATADRLRDNCYWQAHCSDLTRARRTAEVIVEEHPEVALIRTPLLREFGLGAQEGLPRGTTWSKAFRIQAERAGVYPQHYVECLRESPADVKDRAQEFLDVLIDDALRAEAEATEEGDPRVALVVSHGGFLNVMMLAVMKLKKAEIMSNGALAVVDVYGGNGWVKYVPRTLNDSSHIDHASRSQSCYAENFGNNVGK